MGRAIEPLAPLVAQETLSWVRELQLIELALQNEIIFSETKKAV